MPRKKKKTEEKAAVVIKAAAAPVSQEEASFSIWENPIFLVDLPASSMETPFAPLEALPGKGAPVAEEKSDAFFIIRKCQISDLDAICRMQADWEGEEMDPFYIPSGRGELVVRLSPYFLVAESEGKILGYIYGVQKTSQGNPAIADGVEYLDIDRIYVMPDSRGAQIGGRLLEGLMEKAREDGIGKFMVSAATKNVEGIARFFHAHKFKALSILFYR